MDSSQFSDSQPRFEGMEQIASHGATCDAYRVKLYGKLHFLKRLKPQYAHDIRYQEALRKEFETGYRLEHPNLVRYISLTDDGILMEYVDGETLAQFLSNHPDFFRNRKHADRFIRQLLDVVGYLHSHQVLHLDLKPDNMLLTRIGHELKLVDLGFSLTDTFADTQGRTDGFAAPEQLSGGVVDERTDVYAIGKVLEHFPNRHIYYKVINRCTAPAPEDRFQSIPDLSAVLFRRSRQWIWLAVGVLFMALFVVFFLFVNKKRPSAEMMEPPVEVKNVEQETIRVTETILPISRKEEKKEKSANELFPTSPIASSPAKLELSKEDKEFLSQPDLQKATDKEFVLYKERLDEYYSEANAFLNDSSNFKKYPSHVAYLTHYQDIIHKTLQRIKADEQFYPLYVSPMNPISSYTRKYKADLEHRAFVNSNKLP